MLGQHPQFMGLAELNLFLDDWVRPLHRNLEGKGRGNARNGLLRVLAQLMYGRQTRGSVARAKWWLYREDRSTQEVLDTIIDLASPLAIIDKSPATVMSMESLQRMLRMCPDARFLHLTRHPRSCCVSMLEFVTRAGEWGGRIPVGAIDPERLWLSAQSNIMAFCDALPQGQTMRIRGEDLLTDPRLHFPQIFEWLDARSDREAVEATMHPEQSPYACIGPENAMWGNDPNFLENPAFRPGKIIPPPLSGALPWNPQRGFLAETERVAGLLGYGD